MTVEDIIEQEAIPEQKNVWEMLDEIRTGLFDMLNGYAKSISSSAIILMSLMPLSTSADGIIIDDSIPELCMSADAEVLDFVDISKVQEMKVRHALKEKLHNLSLLNDGWDGMEASKPSVTALKQVSMLVSSLDIVALRHCALFPSNDAGIYLQGRLPKGRYTIFLNGEVMAYVLKGCGKRLTATVNVDETTINYLNQGFMIYV